MIKYIGMLNQQCDMCSKYTGKHAYQCVLLFSDLYPEDSKTDLIVCEKCAQREAGKKPWPNIKRKL